MRFYYIKDEYIDYLKAFDTRVALNKKGARPYVGVILEIEGTKYYAPFTSPKPKHQTMKNGIDFRKIKNGVYGAINFNNMIPVLDSEAVLIDIEGLTDEKYKRLLQNQYKAVKSDLEGIRKTAEKLRLLIMKEDEDLSDYDRVVKSRCCNLKLLEEVYRKYTAR